MRSKSDLKTAKLLGSGVDEAYNFGRIGLIVVEKVKDRSIVIWANTLMMNRYSRSPSVLINQDILDIFPDIQFDPNEEMIVKQSNSYTVNPVLYGDEGQIVQPTRKFEFESSDTSVFVVSKLGKITPKGVILSGFICIFATS